MLVSEFKAALSAFLKQVEAYWKEMERDSEARTDEVGFTKAEHLRTKKCQVHVLP
jgi:hypothetical protein